jgi:hypothetical protein
VCQRVSGNPMTICMLELALFVGRHPKIPLDTALPVHCGVTERLFGLWSSQEIFLPDPLTRLNGEHILSSYDMRPTPHTSVKPEGI